MLLLLLCGVVCYPCSKSARYSGCTGADSSGSGPVGKAGTSPPWKRSSWLSVPQAIVRQVITEVSPNELTIYLLRNCQGNYEVEHRKEKDQHSISAPFAATATSVKRQKARCQDDEEASGSERISTPTAGSFAAIDSRSATNMNLWTYPTMSVSRALRARKALGLAHLIEHFSVSLLRLKPISKGRNACIQFQLRMAFPTVLDSLHSIQTCSEGGELGGIRDEQKELPDKQALQ